MNVRNDRGGRIRCDFAPKRTDPVPDPLFTATARSRFGYRLAASGFSDSLLKSVDGRKAFPRRGGTRLCLLKGVPEATAQKLGGGKAPDVVEHVYNDYRSDDAIPEFRAAVVKATLPLRTRIPSPAVKLLARL